MGSLPARISPLIVLLAIGHWVAFAETQPRVSSSLLLLIDTSGSMGDAVGTANPEVKIEVAKQAAVEALGRAAGSGSVEVAVLAFSGDCGHPVPSYQDFTRDVALLTRFIGNLQPSGGTPMATALQVANEFMSTNGSASAGDRMIMLLADGQNDCGDIDQALAELKASGVIFRHETVGFGIAPNSQAADDLRKIATQTGGSYHHASDASQLADVFMEFVDTLTVIDLLGRIGVATSGPRAPSGGPVTTGGSPRGGSGAGFGSAGQASSGPTSTGGPWPPPRAAMLPLPPRASSSPTSTGGPWLAAPAGPQLPPEIQADLYLLRAEEQLQEQDFAGAKGTMDQILDLQQEHDLTLPAEFFFRYARVSERVGEFDTAMEYVTRYLTEAGRDGAHYLDALRLLNTLEVERHIWELLAGMEFVWIPAGEFLMGSISAEADVDEGPLTLVRISKGFWLGQYEVTQEEWEAVMGSNPSSFAGCALCPVEGVSWEDVQEFLRRVNGTGGNRYRLPTEAEWEYAARGGPTGDRYGNLDEIAWWDGNSGGRTHPVGQKLPNGFGLHDVLGNVWEWVQDWYGRYPGGAVTDPQGAGSASARVFRGGGSNSDAGSVRAPTRTYYLPDFRSFSLGFRLLKMP